MQIWRYSKFDAILLLLSIAQLITMLLLADHWENYSLLEQSGSFILLVFMMTYNIIVISHLFTHTPWFKTPLLNCLTSMLNSINAGQSVQIYQLKHVRNHHRYNNDQKGVDNKTKDWSSTFQEGENNEHATLFRYAFIGAASSLINCGRELSSIIRLCKVTEREKIILKLVANSPNKRASELQQIQLDRLAHLFGIIIFLLISWQWTLVCYLPAFYLALALVNVQNYYEHYGAMPNNRAANSVSYYGQFYNLFAFNDGYHQEHHLRPGDHWSAMPEVRSTYADELQQTPRIISSVPAILGFLDYKRELLHRNTNNINLAYEEKLTYE